MRTHRRRRSAIVLATVAMLVLTSCRIYVNDLVTSHRDGQMAAYGATTTVRGTLPRNLADGGVLKVQGKVTSFTPRATNADRPWSATVTLDTTTAVTEIEVSYTVEGNEYVQFLSVINHPSAPDAPDAYATDGVGMRFTNGGLAGLGPVIQDLASSSFDINGLLLGKPVTASGATGTIYEAGAGNISLVPTSTASGVRATVTISDLYVGVDLNVLSLGLINCRLDVRVPTATIDGYYDLAPQPGSPANVDVNLKGGTATATNGQPAITIPTISYEFTSGPCDPDTPLIGGIISTIAGSSVPDSLRSSFIEELQDPDGAGPQDSPIADAIEQSLAGISIAGSVGDAVNAHLDGPFRAIGEDNNGITFRSDANFSTRNPTTGEATCTPTPGAPDIGETATVNSSFPTFGATTPGGKSYGLGLAISPSAFNQMIGAMTECGLVNSTITEFSGQPITPQLLSLLMPEFGQLIPNGTAELEVRVRPTAAPYVTGQPGPAGEPNGMAVNNLHLDFVQTKVTKPDGTVIEAPDGVKLLTVAIDTTFGFQLTWDEASRALKPVLSTPPTSAVRARVVANAIGVSESTTEALFASLFPSLSAGITETFAAFPLPDFLGLRINVVEVAEQNKTFVLYANLDPTPTTKVTNYAFADQSTADFDSDNALTNSSEWRHRIRRTWGSTGGSALFQSSLSADSVVFANNEVAATGGHRTTFTIEPATPGGAWRLEVDHQAAGAYSCRAEGTGGGTCRAGFYGSAMGTAAPVEGSVRINGGAAQTFSFNPSPQGTAQGGGTTNVAFGGSANRVITGTGTAQVELVFRFSQRSGSYCGGLFCGGDGHESSLRFGISDTLTNSFTAGEYPGLGNRQAAGDGHRSSWKVCTNTGVACG